MNTRPIVVGNHAFLFPESAPFTSPAAGICGRRAKPDALDPAWIDPGILDKLKIGKSSDKRDIFAPTPGQRRLYDVIEVNRDLKFTLSLKEASPLMFEHLLGTDPLTMASTQYNPLAGVTKRAWLKVQQYDQDEALINTLDVFCFVEVDGDIEFGEEVVGYDLICRVLHSPLNTGHLAASEVVEQAVQA